MQNWDRNIQDVRFKQKLNNIRSTLPKISSVNNASSSLITKKQQTEKNSPSLNNLENLYINVTNKMKQLTSSPGKQTNVNPPNIHQKKKNPEMKRQNYLKHLLNEFGLSQYLRKLYELGYDDNNINKIGLMSRKKFQELVLNMKMYPGQSIKMEKLYDYLKQLNLANTMYNTRLIGGKNAKLKNNINNKKQFNSEYNKRRIKTASGYNNLLNNNNNNNLNGNYTSYGSAYINNKNNNNTNLNGNNNLINERPKTTTNIKVKPIQKTPSSNYPNSNNKIKSKTIDSNINNYALLSPSYYLSSNNKSNFNTNNKGNSNNILLNSFKKGDLGYGFYMNNNNNHNMNNNNMIEDSKNQKQGNIINYFNEDLISQNDCNNKLENINKFNNNINHNNEGELIEEKMTEDIDNMLKYYMVQLNEKLDDSYGTVEDSSLSYNVSLPFNNELDKKQNLINNNINNSKNNGKIKLPSINDKQTKMKKEEEIKNKNNEDIKAKQENKNINENINEINNKEMLKEKETLNNNNIENKQTVNKESKSTNLENNNEAKILSEQNNENSSKNTTNINIKAEQNKHDSSIEDINFDDFDKDEQEQEKNKENNIKEENINNPNQEKNVNKIENDKNKNENDKGGDIDENIEVIEEINNKNELENNNQEIKYGFHGEKTNSNEKLETSPPNQAQTQNERYSLEENIYDNLRLTKSLGGEYLHQNMDKFDIEYMCRCLSLAIMKLLESGKGKQHITDLMDKENEKFEFFNNFFNTNYNIISEFFDKNKNNEENKTNNNIDNKMSNLEKLELQNNKLNEDNIDINLLKHLKKDIDDKLIKEQEIKNKQYKLKNNLADIEKDIKFIDEFFSMNRQRTKNYKGLTEKTKNIMCKELSYINEVDSEINNTKTNSMISNNLEKNNISRQSAKEEEKKEADAEDNYENEFGEIDVENKKNEGGENNENEININNDINNKFSSISDINNKDSIKFNEKKEIENIDNNNNDNKDDINTNLKIDEVIKTNNEQIKEELPQINNTNNNKDLIESGSMESDYIIDINTMDKFKSYLLKQAEVFDDDFIYSAMHIPTRKYVPPPDPQVIFEFCANIMILTKMEKEVIIITLLYLERFIFNTGLLLTSRNWRRIIFITMAIASKIWDDDSFENNHFAQVFKHLSIGEINLLERTFLEMINYKVYVKCSEYFKYFFIIKSIALKYNYNGVEMIPISVERMMKIQEYAYQMQKRVRKKINLSNSTNF